MASELIQFIYFNSLAWYGARLALTILKNPLYLHKYTGAPVRQTANAKNQKALLLSVLTSREYHKIFKVLELAGIPYQSKDRGISDPIVILGGGAAFQPEPIADLIDVICIGDGEEFLQGVDAALTKKSKSMRLAALAELPGAYIPGKRKIYYDDTGFFIKDIEGENTIIIPHTTKQWITADPFTGRGTDREIELARGCTKNCFFCSIAWRNFYRERSKEEIIPIVKKGGYSYFAPNIGGISYFRSISQFMSKGTKGDVTVDDFCRAPFPESGEYTGYRFTFGIEGISERLRKIVGKPISWDKIDELQTRILAGAGDHAGQQLYFIRGIPKESAEDWNEILVFIKKYWNIWNKARIVTEIQFTPLTKQPQTPLQYIAHSYNRDSERRVMELVARARQEKAKNKESLLYITPSRREASWLLDVLTQCMGRNGLLFIWAQYKGLFNNLSPDSYTGRGRRTIETVARKAGINPDVIIGDWDFNAYLPWDHILPGGEVQKERMLKAAKSIRRMLEQTP